jgi:hypothetical protein
MANYISDRAFTDHIHNNVAIPVIYNPINWAQVNLDPDDAVHIDMFQGIDYVFNHNGATKTVQERFRERKYQQYSDFTIRYRRDGNMHSDRHQSEYYKMKADYFTYGITNCLKDDLTQCTDFLKYAIIDLRIVYSKIDAGDIFIRDNGRNTCRIIDNKIECPVKFNTDGSSSFFPIEISFLIDLWGNDIIIAQKGFI